MKKLLLFVLLIPFAYAECAEIFDSEHVSQSISLCSDTFDYPNGIKISADNVVLDCNTAILRGSSKETGIMIENRTNVTILNCNVLTYDVGIYLKNSNHITIHDNAWLKNKIGIRLYQSFENTIYNNADKSFLKPVSSIASKFNSIDLSNKRLDKSFCEVNLCNEQGTMNPCVDGDFYCSASCSYENDSDCPAPKEIPEAKETADEMLEAAKEEEKAMLESPMPELITTNAVQSTPLKTKAIVNVLVYVILYAVAFLLLQYHQYKHKHR